MSMVTKKRHSRGENNEEGRKGRRNELTKYERKKPTGECSVAYSPATSVSSAKKCLKAAEL
jgi:hypothetical protein